MPTRIQYVADDTVKTLVQLRQGRTCSLDVVSTNAAMVSPLYRERTRAVPLDDDGQPVPGVPGQRDTVPDVPDGRDTAGQERDNVGHDGGTGAGQDVPESTWLDGPDVPLAELVRLHEQSMTAGQRDIAERARAALMAELEPPKLSEQDAVEALMSALRVAGPDGAHVRDLAVAATRARSWTYAKLPKLGAHTTKRGNWALPSKDLVNAG